jgi:hypothetical protein
VREHERLECRRPAYCPLPALDSSMSMRTMAIRVRNGNPWGEVQRPTRRWPKEVSVGGQKSAVWAPAAAAGGSGTRRREGSGTDGWGRSDSGTVKTVYYNI